MGELRALPATRLYELWVERQLFGSELAVKVGQRLG